MKNKIYLVQCRQYVIANSARQAEEDIELEKQVALSAEELEGYILALHSATKLADLYYADLLDAKQEAWVMFNRSLSRICEDEELLELIFDQYYSVSDETIVEILTKQKEVQ